jgi:uncharacterized lipoprotein
MTFARGIAAGAVSLLLAACAQPQAVSVTPEVRVPSSELGRGQAVQVSVADRRPSPLLGGVGTYEAGTDLVVQGDLAAIVREALLAGMLKQGFKPMEAASARELRVELLSLDYGIVDRSELSRHVEAASRLKAECIRDKRVELERAHRGELRQAVFLTAHDARANSRYLSAVVSDALNALLADRELLACLAR